MSEGILDPTTAAKLVDAVEHATSRESAQACALEAGQFLIGQLQVLRAKANGYPRNPIDGATWFAGRDLAETCDRFANSAGRHRLANGEEQATALAVAMALQVMAHYPDEIFPRVLRNARCLEARGKEEEAVGAYQAIRDDFEQMDLDEILDEIESDTVPDEATAKILSAVVDAIDGLARLRPSSLAHADGDRRRRAVNLLSRRPPV